MIKSIAQITDSVSYTEPISGLNQEDFDYEVYTQHRIASLGNLVGTLKEEGLSKLEENTYAAGQPAWHLLPYHPPLCIEMNFTQTFLVKKKMKHHW